MYSSLPDAHVLHGGRGMLVKSARTSTLSCASTATSSNVTDRSHPYLFPISPTAPVDRARTRNHRPPLVSRWDAVRLGSLAREGPVRSGEAVCFRILCLDMRSATGRRNGRKQPICHNLWRPGNAGKFRASRRFQVFDPTLALGDTAEYSAASDGKSTPFQA